jgi:hypothetical protein
MKWILTCSHSGEKFWILVTCNAVDAALLVLRVFAGAAFVLHGPWSSQK